MSDVPAFVNKPRNNSLTPQTPGAVTFYLMVTRSPFQDKLIVPPTFVAALSLLTFWLPGKTYVAERSALGCVTTGFFVYLLMTTALAGQRFWIPAYLRFVLIYTAVSLAAFWTSLFTGWLAKKVFGSFLQSFNYWMCLGTFSLP